MVEGHGKAGWLQHTGLDMGALGNVFVMANTPGPRHFYQVSKIVLMPSLRWESFPRVAVEWLANGIPVLGSNSGGLPETLHGADFLFDIPERYTPQIRLARAGWDLLDPSPVYEDAAGLSLVPVSPRQG